MGGVKNGTDGVNVQKLAVLIYATQDGKIISDEKVIFHPRLVLRINFESKSNSYRVGCTLRLTHPRRR